MQKQLVVAGGKKSWTPSPENKHTFIFTFLFSPPQVRRAPSHQKKKKKKRRVHLQQEEKVPCQNCWSAHSPSWRAAWKGKPVRHLLPRSSVAALLREDSRVQWQPQRDNNSWSGAGKNPGSSRHGHKAHLSIVHGQHLDERLTCPERSHSRNCVFRLAKLANKWSMHASGWWPKRVCVCVSSLCCGRTPILAFLLVQLSLFWTRNERAPDGVTSKAPQLCFENNCHNIHYYDETELRPRKRRHKQLANCRAR